MSAPRSLLEEVLPRFDAREVHDLWIPARPNVVFAAVKEVTVQEVRLLTPLETLRGLPNLLTGRAAFRPHRSAPVLDEFTVGVVPLGERDGAEIAAGAVGRFWRLAGNEPAAVSTREDFVAFAEPGYAKAVIAFLVRAERGGSRVLTETRVVGTSPEATRALLRYWLAIRLGSGAIRRSWLAAIRRRAVRACYEPDTADLPDGVLLEPRDCNERQSSESTGRTNREHEPSPVPRLPVRRPRPGGPQQN